MTRRGIVNTMVALIAILITGGMAAVAVIDGPPTSRESELVAAGVERESFAIEFAEPEADPRATVSTPARPRPTTTTPGRPAGTTVITVPAPPETTPAPATTAAPATTIAPPPAFPFPMPPGGITPPTPPPTTVQTSPSSWRLVANGVTVDARIEPAAPQVGDTVTVTYTATGDADFCCMSFVYVGDTIISQNLLPIEGPCPYAPQSDGQASIVMSEPGPFTFQVQATRIDPFCVGPPTFHTANLFGTFPVLPAA